MRQQGYEVVEPRPLLAFFHAGVCEMAVVTSVHCCWVILIHLPETPPGLMFSVALLGTVEMSAPLPPHSGKRCFLRAKTGVVMFLAGVLLHSW